jgi:uncharacterized tellurite resistance protein B-like protein
MDHLNKKLFGLFPDDGQPMEKEELKRMICNKFRLTSEDLDIILKEMEEEGKVKQVKKRFFEI